jgi:hypothetical protein
VTRTGNRTGAGRVGVGSHASDGLHGEPVMRRVIVGAAMVLAVAVVLGSAGDAAAAKPRAKKKAPIAATPFQKLDTNRDGKLSRDEFRNVRSVAGKGKGGKGGDTDALFTKLDTNNDNSLSQAEFARMGQVMAQGKKKNK